MFKLTYRFPVSVAFLFLFTLFILSPLLLKEFFFPEEVYQHLVSASNPIVGASLPSEGMACLVTRLTGDVTALPLSFV